uniref:Cell surface A33 antigen-like n=1 Tax=Paramormyrops kingsleyae TaxID=1676925 RepID=A0A3B3SE44_9TELE|nr:cell surface A33 antigen-like [Paramormyrops kingsleyae]
MLNFIIGTYGKMGIAEAFYIFAVLSAASGIQVSIPQKVYEVARGDNISLPCTFTSNVKVTTSASANWAILGGTPDDPTSDPVATYYFSENNLDVSAQFANRASMNPQFSTGQIDLSLSNIMMSDNATFECQVQIPKDMGGKPNAKTRLVVLVAPSVPACGIQGSPTIGQDIMLTCKSSEGSPVPTYTWQSFDKNNIPRALPPRATSKDGVLSLFNISADTTGYYICTSANKIRSQSCNYTLAVTLPSMSVGSAAIFAGVGLAALLVVGIIIYCCCCRRREKDTEGYEMGETEQPLDDSIAKANTVEYCDDKRSVNCKDGLDVRAEQKENGRDDEDHDDYGGRQDNYDDRRSDYSGRRDNYDDRRSDYSGRRDNYDDRSDYSGRRDNYDDRRSDYSGRRDNYDDRRSDYSGRRDNYDDRSNRYDDRRDRYDDRRDDYDRRDQYDDRRDDYDRRDQYDDRRDRHGSYDDHNDRRNQYDEVSDNDHETPPSVPPNKPRKMD